MSDPNVLMRVEGQSPLLLTRLEDRQMAEAVVGWREAGLTVRCVRGRKMSRLAGLMDEFSAALHFPYYSRQFDWTNGGTVRDWLSGQSYEVQHSLGLRALDDIQAGAIR
jgi:hypothetical protein